MKDFNGLPTPAAAGIVSGYILIYTQDNVITSDWLPMVAIVLTALKLLMVESAIILPVSFYLFIVPTF